MGGKNNQATLNNIRKLVDEISELTGKKATFESCESTSNPGHGYVYWLSYKTKRISPKLKAAYFMAWMDGALTFLRLK